MEGFLANSITIGVVFLFGCLGELLMEKAGQLNLGIPGIMCIGTAGGCWGTVLGIQMIGTTNVMSGFVIILMAMLMAMLFAAVAGLIYAFLTVSLRANQNVTGLALTIFGSGFSSFFISTQVNSAGLNSQLTYSGLNFFQAYLPFADNLGWFGTIFLKHGILVYVAIALAVFFAIMLRKMRVGLHLRAVGENPSTADAAGINVTKYKYVFILIGSAVAGLGGLSYVMEYMGGIIGSNVTMTVEGIGWLAIALVIFTLWKPDLAILGSIVFGALYIAANYITGVDFVMKKLLNLIPYVVTVLVLIATSIRGKKENMAPASLGTNFFREER